MKYRLVCLLPLVLVSCGGSNNNSASVPTGSENSTINSESALDDLRQFIEIVRGSPFVQSIEYANLLVKAVEGLTVTESEFDPVVTNQINYQYTCEYGGTYTSSVKGSGTQPVDITGTALACDVGDAVLDGQISAVRDVQISPDPLTLTLTNFTVTMITGEVHTISGSTRDSAELQGRTRILKITSFNGFYGGSNYVVSNLSVEQLVSYTEGDSAHSLDANFGVTQPFTNTGVISVTTKQLFESGGSPDYYPVGNLTATANDNSQIIFEADTGDNATFALTTTDSAGAITSETVDWSEDYILPCIEDVVPRPGLIGCIE